MYPTQTARCGTLICILTCAEPLTDLHTTHSPTSSPVLHLHLVDLCLQTGQGLLLQHDWENAHLPPFRCHRYRRLRIPEGSSFSRPVWTVASGKRTNDIARSLSANGMSVSGKPPRALGADGSCRKCRGTMRLRRRQTLLRRRPPRVASVHWQYERALEHVRRVVRPPIRGGQHQRGV
jgi:hypothetical protein